MVIFWDPTLGGKGAFAKKFSKIKGTTPLKYLQDDTKMKSLRQFVDIDMPRTNFFEKKFETSFWGGRGHLSKNFHEQRARLL